MKEKTVRFRKVKILKNEVELLTEFEEILGHNLTLVDKIPWDACEVDKLLSKAESFMYSNQKEKVDFVWQFTVSNNSVTGIGLFMNHILTIPDLVSKFTSLEYLVLSGGDLETIPESIGNLKSLKILFLGANHIKEIANSIGNLSNLTYLWLNANYIKQLPKSIGELKSLEELHLGFNYLDTLPNSMKNLTSLKTLNLHNSRIKEVPEWIGDLSSLENLHLGENNLTVIPNSIKNLGSLKHLDLQKNNLTSLPEGVASMKSLQYLSLQHNENIKLIPKTLNILKNRGISVVTNGDQVSIDYDLNKRIVINELIEEGKILMEKCEYDNSLDKFYRSMELINELSNPESLMKFKAVVLHLQGRVYLLQENYNESLKTGEEMLEIHEKLGDIEGKAIALNNIGNTFNMKGEYKEALKFYEDGLELLKSIGLETSPNALTIIKSLEDLKNSFNESKETKNLSDTNIFEDYKANSKGIKRVEIDKNKLTLFWPDNQQEEFYLKNLKKITLITTDEGPLEPDIFWLLMFKIPIMIPSDDLIPGSLKITDVLLEFENFNHEKFIQAMSSAENNVFELWEKE